MLKSKKDILDSLARDPDMMAILSIIRDLDLKDSWLAAGSVRNFIWNILSGKSGFDMETDVDVIFYDPEVSYEETLALETKLGETHPQYRWELKNQVYMHIHNPETEPYISSCDAMSKYPERCTAIGLRLLGNGELELFAPYGLEDILNFRIQPTPHFTAHPDRIKVYEDRLVHKKWTEKWQLINVIR